VSHPPDAPIIAREPRREMPLNGFLAKAVPPSAVNWALLGLVLMAF
jgi:hypothetical protein